MILFVLGLDQRREVRQIYHVDQLVNRKVMIMITTYPPYLTAWNLGGGYPRKFH